MAHSVEVIEADLNRKEHQRDVLELVDAYAQDPMGDGWPLSAEARDTLIPALMDHPTTIIFLAYQSRCRIRPESPKPRPRIVVENSPQSLSSSSHLR